jgi:hypothetical protein
LGTGYGNNRERTEGENQRKSTGRKKLGFLSMFFPPHPVPIKRHRNIVVGQARLQKEPNMPTRLRVYYRN